MASLNRSMLSPASLRAQLSPPKQASSMRENLRLGLLWLAFLAVSIGVTLMLVIVELHPPLAHLEELLLYLGAIGAGSLVAGQLALWLAGTSRRGGIRVKLALLPLLTAGVIALDVLLLARLMFITVEDGRLLLLFLVFATLVALGISVSLGSSLSARIRAIEHGARRLAAGEYDVRLKDERADGPDEITHLADWFNHMAAAVQDSFARQQSAEDERRQIVASLSHDLRTPLTSIRAMIEAIDDGVVTDLETVRRYQRTVRAEMGHLSGLLDDLFELSRLESGTLSLNRERMSLEDLLSDALEGAHTFAEHSSIHLEGRVDGALPLVSVDARQLHRVLTNLLQNALRHTAPGGSVLLRAKPEPGSNKGYVLVQVLDTGEGIPPHDLPHVFAPTYRGEASRRRTSAETESFAGAGAGLGLAIARSIVEAHGGRIWAASPIPPELRSLVSTETGATSPPGTTLSFTLPAAE